MASMIISLLLKVCLAQAPQPGEHNVVGAAVPTAPPTMQAPPPPAANIEIPDTGNAEASGETLGQTQALPTGQFIYDPTTGRDPFKMPKGVRVDRDPKKQIVVESKDPMQRINLDRVQILGIIWDSAHPRAMIRDSDSKAVFTISKNAHLGPNQGIVTDIREGSIVVLEVYTNDDGDDVKIPRVISIRK